MALSDLDRFLCELSDQELSAAARWLAHNLARSRWPRLRKLELILTEDCNLRCSYCWVPKKPISMSPDIAHQAVDFLLAESGGEEQVSITLFGGEPLQVWDTFQDTVLYLVDGRDEIRHRCANCRHRSVCTGGCPATNWLLTGSPYVAPRLDCQEIVFFRRLRRLVPEAYEACSIPFAADPSVSCQPLIPLN